MKREIYNPYNFAIIHRLADGTQVTEDEIKEILSNLPPVQLNMASGVKKCINL